MQANITESQMSEKVTFGLVGMAMKCYQGIFKHSDAVEHVFDTEDPDRYPSGSHWTISKLVEVTRKATLANTVVTERVIEMLSAVNFRVRDGQLEAGETTIKGLSGRGQPGNKGLLDFGIDAIPAAHTVPQRDARIIANRLWHQGHVAHCSDEPCQVRERAHR